MSTCPSYPQKGLSDLFGHSASSPKRQLLLDMPIVAALLPFAAASGLTDYARNHCIFSISGTVQRTESWMRSPSQIVKSIEAARPKTVVLHFHGGLVDTEMGLIEAASLGSNVYRDAAYPIHFIWESGAAYAAAPPKADWSGWGPRIFKSSPGHGADEGPFPVPLAGGDSGRLKPLMLPVRSGWRQIKRYAELTCDPRIREAAVPKFLDSFIPYWQKHPDTKVVIVTHSAGAFLAGHMLELIQARYPRFGSHKFDLVMVAPACTYEFIGQRSYLFTRYIDRIRLFGLAEETEKRDLVSGYLSLRGVDRFFPGSIMYLISNHMEERHDTMLLGMERFKLLGSGRATDRKLTSREASLFSKVDRILKLETNSFWSPSPQTGATRHTGFFDDPRTIASIRSILLHRPK